MQRARQRVRGSRELEGAATFAGEILKVKWGDVEWTAKVQSLNTVNSFPNSDVVQTPDRGPEGEGSIAWQRGWMRTDLKACCHGGGLGVAGMGCHLIARSEATACASG